MNKHEQGYGYPLKSSGCACGKLMILSALINSNSASKTRGLRKSGLRQV